MDNKKTIINALETRKVSTSNKEYTSPTSIWKNSIYSFNQNYVKNIPSVDNIVNKMIKSFFTINALDNNIEGKKSRLVQRRYKRLSLNKIFVSKSEIKHSNNKVVVTIYLFNKKRNSLMLNLSKLYNSLSLGFSNVGYKNLSWAKKNNFERLASEFFKSINTNNKKEWKVSSLLLRDKNTISRFSSIKTNSSIKLNNTNLSKTLYNTDKNLELKKIFTNKYAFMPISYKINRLDVSKTNGLDNKKKYSSSNSLTSVYNFKDKIYNYNRLNNLTKYNVSKFINSLDSNYLSKVNYKLIVLIFNFFTYTNQYKLYNNKTVNLYNEKLELTTFFKNSYNFKDKLSLSLKKLNYSMYKLKSIHKLFALYNSFNIGINNINDNHFSQLFSNKLLLNTYKLLKKTQTQNLKAKLYPTKESSYNNKVSLYKGKYIEKSLKTNVLGRSFKKEQQNTIVLMKKLNRIDRFFSKYENIFFKSDLNSNYKDIFPSYKSNLCSQVISNYKISFINDLLEKELLYVHYLKLLSYNNATFKNWFLFPLKNLMAKLYNKKIYLNIIYLKYIHLNSDILSQAVDIRLRNFRKNKLVEVLKRAVKLVSISKINIYACDEHSSMYKYIHDYYNKYRDLKLNIFRELNILEKQKTAPDSKINNAENNKTFIPCIIRRLNHIQTSTINFIKFKSVFGVRLEAAGRLTKRSTASRALFKFRYKGSLKNNSTINNTSTTLIRNHQISNLQFTKISSKTRNGSFGLKGWINSN